MRSSSTRLPTRKPYVPIRLSRNRINGQLIGAVTLTAAGLALIALSPFALQYMAAETSGVNWQKLSNVGQTYDAVSALLVALGLAGVVGTIVLQIRESRHNRVQAARDGHNNLMRMALEDPDILRFWHAGARDLTLAEDKVSIYLNLVVQFWLALWEFDDIDELELRNLCATDLFKADDGRKFWRNFQRSGFETGARSRHGKRFYQILGEEYERAIRSPEYPEDRATYSRVQVNWKSPASSAGAALAGAVIGGTTIFTIMRSSSKRLGARVS